MFAERLLVIGNTPYNSYRRFLKVFNLLKLNPGPAFSRSVAGENDRRTLSVRAIVLHCQIINKQQFVEFSQSTVKSNSSFNRG